MIHFPEWVHEATSAHTLAANGLPGIKPFVEAVSDIRSAAEEVAKISNFRRVTGLNDSGNWLRAAVVPAAVFIALERVDPAFATDPQLFLAWLKAHPEYQTGKFTAMQV